MCDSEYIDMRKYPFWLQKNRVVPLMDKVLHLGQWKPDNGMNYPPFINSLNATIVGYFWLSSLLALVGPGGFARFCRFCCFSVLDRGLV